MLELRDIRLSYPGNFLFGIDDVQLSTGFHLLIGANGTGKSTLLRSLVTQPVPGMLLDGESLDGLSVAERAKKIAFVASSFPGLDYMNLEEYLLLGRHPHTGKSGRASATDLEVVRHHAAQFRLEKLLKRVTSSLSDGERQRASVARAFIQETPVILLDEPTSFLDYPFKKEILSELRSAAEKEHKIVIASSHDLELARPYATSFLVIDPLQKQLVVLKSETSFETLLQTAFPVSSF